MIEKGNLAKQVAERIAKTYDYTRNKISEKEFENMHNGRYDDVIDESCFSISVLNIQISDSEKKYALGCLPYLKGKIDSDVSQFINTWEFREFHDKCGDYTIEIQDNTLIIKFPFEGMEVNDERIEEIVKEMTEIEKRRKDMEDPMYDYDFKDDDADYSARLINDRIDTAQYAIYDLEGYLQESDYVNYNNLVDDLKPLATELGELRERLYDVYSNIIHVYKKKGLLVDNGDFLDEEDFDV